jgi:hypothetical protein
MNEDEKVVMQAIVNVWNAFITLLPPIHKDETTDFRYHIHRLQDIVASRQAKIDYNNE